MHVSYALTLPYSPALPFASADAQSNFKPQSVEEIDAPEQPGYEPSPDEERLPTALEKQVVFFRTTEAPGTIIIHTDERFLYLVMANSRAIRYGIGVGRDGFQWRRPAEDLAQAGMAGLAAAAGDDPAPALSAALHGRRSRQSARRARALSRRSRSIASTAPTSRRRSATPSRRAASGWSTTT